MKRVRPADMTEIYALRAETIDYFFPERDEEVEFWADLASDYGDDILHLMCGTGELTVGLARKGYNVTGIDVTQSMIYEAKDRLDGEDLDNVEFIQEDARYFKLDKKFDFVFISTGDFHHFTEREEVDSLLAKAYAHLRPGGAVALELYPLPNEGFKRPEKKFRTYRDTPEDWTVWKRNKSSYHPENQMLEIMEHLHVDKGDEVTKGDYEIQLRLFSEDEMDEILKENGFSNIKHFGGYDFSPYVEDSDTWIAVGER